MFLNILLILTLFALSVFSYVRHFDILYPPFINSTLWFLILLLSTLQPIDINEISNYTLFIINLGVFSFFFGGYLATFEKKPSKNKIPAYPNQKDTASTIFLVIATIGFIFTYKKMQEFGLSGISDNFFFNLRYSLSNEEDLQTYGIYAYFSTFAYLSVLFHITFTSKRKNLYLLISILLAIGFAISSAGRTSLFMMVISILGVLLITRKLSIYQGLIHGLILLLIIFILMSILVGKSGSNDLTLIEKIFNSYEAFMQYLLGGIVAFDQWLAKVNYFDYGENSLRTIFSLLNTIGLDVQTKKLIQEYEEVPFMTNVYTVHKQYYADFGILGILLFQMIFGYMHSRFYYLATKKIGYYIIYYALFLYPLFMQFFEDQYFSLLSTWIQFSVLIFLYSKINNIKVKRKEL
jgi:oligosaccharide repeat unit polymerase